MADPSSGQALTAFPPLARGFYQRPTVEVALDLLGKLLVRRLPEGLVVVRLTEVEAYLGVGDPACHTFGGRRTPRTEAMWGEGGRLYVYFTYGMHFCANVVTRGVGEPEAALLRGGLVVAGAELVARRRGRADLRGLLDGPAKLCQGLGIDRTLYDADLSRADAIWVADDGWAPPDGSVRKGPRVGVAYAGEAASWALRFRVGEAELSALRAARRACAGAASGARGGDPPAG
ncbi:MAG TPA: DNA-3-methyladenine glycosylase, partial [Thermoanaerobaculaceae bacterium]|nr:DNA-3-methyladenine glycosylase [Thermoanaerobaculaceae bacterium]